MHTFIVFQEFDVSRRWGGVGCGVVGVVFR